MREKHGKVFTLFFENAHSEVYARKKREALKLFILELTQAGNDKQQGKRAKAHSSASVIDVNL
jgi:hypothetical protein